MEDDKAISREAPGEVDADNPASSEVCPRCGQSPCACPAFPDVLSIETLDFAPPDADVEPQAAPPS